MARRAKSRQKNVFCIEGNWSSNIRTRTNIKNALQFLEDNSKIKTYRRDCCTIEEFEDRLKVALQKGNDGYSILYFAFHGKEGLIDLGRKKCLSLEDIADIVQGNAKNKIIHFGSCSTLNVPKKRLNDFLRSTGALAVSGFTKEIEFIASTFLDMLYFKHCQDFLAIDSINRKMQLDYKQLMKELGFTMIYEK